MKLRIVMDIEASSTMLDTITRNGFNLVKVGSGFQCESATSPTIPRRKLNVKFIPSPKTDFDQFCSQEPDNEK